ncbi:MAG: hypothetical protein QOF02_2905, partial [Blastocatellia bacterium]|nr:hypothetical protein [Blastocatellia bacterium]
TNALFHFKSSRIGSRNMNRRHLAGIMAALLLTLFSNAALAAGNDNEMDDSETLIVNAKVVEVAEGHISVIARSGIEHVIAIDNADTKVTIEEQAVSLKDVREGDVVTIQLDEKNPMKFAKMISMNTEQVQVARVRR